MNKLNRKYRIQGKDAAHRDLLIRSLVTDLIQHEKIKIGTERAKIIKSQFDRLVTIAKKGDSRKNVIEAFFASNDRVIERFYKVVAEKCADRNSGYTRIIKTMPRKGDMSAQAYLMLVNAGIKETKSEVEKLLEKQEKAKKAPKKKAAPKAKK